MKCFYCNKEISFSSWIFSMKSCKDCLKDWAEHKLAGKVWFSINDKR